MSINKRVRILVNNSPTRNAFMFGRKQSRHSNSRSRFTTAGQHQQQRQYYQLGGQITKWSVYNPAPTISQAKKKKDTSISFFELESAGNYYFMACRPGSKTQQDTLYDAFRKKMYVVVLYTPSVLTQAKKMDGCVYQLPVVEVVDVYRSLQDLQEEQRRAQQKTTAVSQAGPAQRRMMMMAARATGATPSMPSMDPGGAQPMPGMGSMPPQSPAMSAMPPQDYSTGSSQDYSSPPMGGGMSTQDYSHPPAGAGAHPAPPPLPGRGRGRGRGRGAPRRPPNARPPGM